MPLPPVILFGDDVAAYGALQALRARVPAIHVVSRAGRGAAFRSRFIAERLVLPPGADDFITQVNRWAAERGAGDAALVVVGDDDYLEALARGRAELLPTLRPTFPGWGVVERVRRKALTYEIAREVGVATPATHAVGSRDELEQLLGARTDLAYPLLMKPEQSARFQMAFGVKAVIAADADEALAHYDRHAGFYGELLLQEYIPGPEAALVCLKAVLNRDSRPVAIFMDRKRRSSRRFAACSLSASTWVPEVAELGLRLLERVGYVGYTSTEFKYDARDGVYKLMEINGRVSLNNSHALRCGINLPLAMVAEAATGPLPPLKAIRRTWPEDVLWWSPITDLASLRYQVLDGTFNWAECCRAFRGRGFITEPAHWRDPVTTAVTAGRSLYNLAALALAMVRKRP